MPLMLTRAISSCLATLTVCAVVAAGCAPATPFVRPPPSPGRGTLYVYRVGAFVGAAVNGGVSLVDGGGNPVRAFTVRGGKYVVTEVPAGRINLTAVGPNGRPGILPVDVPEQGVAFVRCQLVIYPWVPAGLGCQQVPNDMGESQASRLRLNMRGD